MKFTHFRFINFKGIGDQTIDLQKVSGSSIFALVGLNESGKTTILEAINSFIHKAESLGVLKLDSYEISDVNDLIPINRRDNFNDTITIEVGLELEDKDIKAIKSKLFEETEITISEVSRKFTLTQSYHFKNSTHEDWRDIVTWTFHAKGKPKRAKSNRYLTNNEKGKAFSTIKEAIPSILYFPNFLFEFPERIYLDDGHDDAKHLFYQKIIQDILDSLNNDTNINEHLIARINSNDEKEKRNLKSLKGKMEKKLSQVIFNTWNDIFSKKINEKHISLDANTDDTGPYIEFYIEDDVDTYRINERSLGFRWFFVYVLLTQFRSFRKQKSNALFLFDEPASNLHPSAQSELLKSFENLPSVLYTTHSHYLINAKWLENTFIVKNAGIDYDHEEDYDARNTDIRIMKYREFVSKYPSQTSYFQPILEILDYRPSNLELVPRVILTEGKNDFYTFSYYQETIKKYKTKLYFVPGTSSSNLSTLISLYLGWGTSFTVLLDSDREGLSQKNRYIEMFGKSVENKIITYEDINPQWTKFETEKLFSKSDQLKLQKSVYPDQIKFNKKLFNRAVQENLVNEKSVSLSKESHDNFLNVLKHLKLLLKSK